MAIFRKWITRGDVLPEDDRLRGLLQIIMIVSGNKILKTGLKIWVGMLISQNIMFMAYLYFWSVRFEDIMKMLPLQILTSSYNGSIHIGIIVIGFMIGVWAIIFAELGQQVIDEVYKSLYAIIAFYSSFNN